MFTFTAVLGILELAISRIAGAQQKQSFVETICALTRLFRGSSLIMSQAKEAMCGEVWNSIFRDEDSKRRLRHLTIDHDDFPMPDGEPLDDMLAKIDQMFPPGLTNGQTNGDGNSSNEDRTNAVKYLRRLTAIQGPDGREAQFLSWPVLWTDEFMRDIQEGEPKCEATLACYGLVLRHLNDRWWAKDFGQDLVLEIASGASNTVLASFYDKILNLIESASG